MVTLLDLFLLGIQQLSKNNIAKLNVYWKKFHTTNTTGSFVLIFKNGYISTWFAVWLYKVPMLSMLVDSRARALHRIKKIGLQ